MVTFPEVTPETTPVPLMVAVEDGPELLQVPAPEELVSVIVAPPAHTAEGPVIATGNGLTVIVL